MHVLEAIESGCARHVVDIVRTTTGIRHHVAAPVERVGGVTDRQAAARITAAGGQMHRIEMRRSVTSPRNAVALAQLRRLVRRLRPDVIHGHSSIGGALGRVVASGTTAARVYTPNALASGALAGRVETLLGRATDVLIAVSESERDDLLGRRLVDPDRLVMIPNGIEVDPPPERDLRATIGLDRQTPLVGTMGRIIEQKAHDHFALAAAQIARRDSRVHFVLIGDGPDRTAIVRMARDALGPRFHWIAELPDAAAYLHDLDVFVLTSRFEGGPYAPLEAMRAGVPVVLTDVRGNRDVVEDGRSGRLVPFGDPAAVADAVGDLLGDAEARSRLVRAGQERVRASFDVRVMGARLSELYSLVRRRSR